MFRTYICLAFAGFLATNAMAQTSDEEDPGLHQLAVEYYVAKYRVGRDEADSRLRLQDRAAGIDDRLTELLGDQFADIWFDHSDSGRLKIGMTRAAGKYTADVLRVVNEFDVGKSTDLVPVAWSTAELGRIQDSVRDSLTDMIRAGHARTGRDPKLNRVIVTAIQNLSTPEEGRIAKLASTDGVAVRRVDEPSLIDEMDACHIKHCNPRIRGARQIVDNVSCTAAFSARDRDVPSRWLLITAGHCILFGGINPTWQAYDESPEDWDVGPSYDYVVAGESGADAGAIQIANPSSNHWTNGSQPLAQVIIENSDITTYNPNYPIRKDSGNSMGTLLCYSGATSGTHCAEVSGLDTDHTTGVNGIYSELKHLGELDMCVSQPGDSGAPIFRHYRAYGILIGGNSSGTHCYTTYQGIRGAQDLLNVKLLLSP
jgi:hypothetical protein